MIRNKALKKKNFNIFNTFDVFSCEAMSILKDKIIKFVLIEADNFFIPKFKGTEQNRKKFMCPVFTSFEQVESNIHAENIDENTIYFSVLNNKRMYNLLTNSWRRYNDKAKNENIGC
jgi:phospholipase C